MPKPIPLTRRLELAFTEINSTTDEEKIYANLYQIVKDFKTNPKSFQDFYDIITHKSLLESITYSSNDVEKGKSIESKLKSSISLPTVGGVVKDYRGKMLKSMEIEYSFLKDDIIPYLDK